MKENYKKLYQMRKENNRDSESSLTTTSLLYTRNVFGSDIETQNVAVKQEKSKETLMRPDTFRPKDEYFPNFYPL